MYSKSDFYEILDFYFAKNKLMTANRKFFERIENLQSNNDQLHSFPWTVSWQITSGCNLRCKHCFFEGNENFYNTKNNLDEKTLLNLADELIALNIVAVSLSGGETLLRNDLFKLLKKLKNKNIAISLQTNATLINQDYAQIFSEILNPYTDYIQVSLDGAQKETFEKIRGINTYDKVINGIKCLVNAGINVNANATILASNSFELPQIYKVANELNIKKLSLTNFVPSNEKHSYLQANFETIIKPLVDTIRLAKNNKTFLEFNYSFFDFLDTNELKELLDEYLELYKKEITISQNISCHKHNTLFINQQGEVYLCYNCSMKEGLLGKYPNSSMEKIWENRKSNIFFKKRLTKNSDCKTCKYFKFCRAGCMGNAYQKYNSINAPDGLCKYNSLNN